MSATFTRVLGAATLAYSVAIAARPHLLARPCGLGDTPEQVPPATALLIRAVGARDAATGAAMLLARDPRARRLTTVCRLASDLGDAALFGTLLPDRDRRAKVAGIAAGWGALCAAAALLDGDA